MIITLFQKTPKKHIIIITISFVSLCILALLIAFSGNCKNDFNVYPEKGYCEFNLKVCEGIFGCKEYEKVQVPCGSKSNLCGEKVFCDCGNINS